MIDGLKPYPEYKATGLLWLGKIPQRWNAESLRRKLQTADGIKIGPCGSQLKLDQMTEGGFKVYGQAQVIGRNFKKGRKYIDDNKFNELGACAIEPGDLLITMMGSTGRCAVVPDDIEPGLMDSHLLRLRVVRHELNPQLLRRLSMRRRTLRISSRLVGRAQSCRV